MKNLPIGIQEFSEFKANNYIYIDKTEYIYQLLQNKYYFLSRPRRFGKSLLLNTIKEIFNGKRELFEGLWIYDKIDWEQYPVIKISMSNIGHDSLGLEDALDNMLSDIAGKNDIKLSKPAFSLRFKELIEKLSENKQVVILIDEYDKPIIDYIDDIPKAEKNRKILKSFYSIIKDSDSYIKFFFVTGVSKFSQVSIFSDLNNLSDITLDKNFAVLTGYTQEELEKYFPDYIKKVSADYSGIYDDIMVEIEKWYDGYSWDGVNFVYNPFSILNFFSKREFDDYWFSTGTPTFLTKLIKENKYTVFDLTNKTIFRSELNKYEITNISLIPLLFQTGYLTIKKVNQKEKTLLLDYPNSEVEMSFSIHLLSELNGGNKDNTNTVLIEIVKAFNNNSIEKFVELINTLFKGISYTLIEKKEKYFHSIFYIIMRVLGFTIESEVLTIDGRIDAAVFTDDYIYVLEFKAAYDSKKGVEQIIDKGYHKKYSDDKRKKILIGINFNTETKCIDDYEVMEI
ncbi:MAG: hypothetical protein B6D61_03360 [Bacteroidetes bacterium 4484_249]|nr:MAG: hypothetical protein B6D61_03360 [Bacteroidetes bacterium 4484_249]